MDVHRARFIPYPPSAINALAFSHSTGQELGGHESLLRLAVGRANGDIEIWNPLNGAWVQETIFHGGRDRSVEGLAWIQEPEEIDANGNKTPSQLRLFSIGYSTTVTEWDLSKGVPMRSSSGNYSEVWCLAAQPRWRQESRKTNDKKKAQRAGEWRGQNLVVGCADGTLAMLSTAENDLQFQKFLTRQTAKKARVLSVTWKDRNIVVAGFANSTVGVYDVRSSNLIRSITLGAGPAGGPKDILVWTVKCLPNGDIVSGDSTGEVRFFEGKNYSQYQRISGHEADVLDLAISPDGRTIWSAGMDRRTVIYNNTAASSNKRQWAKAAQKAYHDHDVKAMATFESKKLSIIASGGIDTNLVIIPMRSFWSEHHRTVSGLPQAAPLVSAPGQRIVVSWWERELSIWHVKDCDMEGKPYTLMARIALIGDENITSASVSQDGTVLAAATTAGVKLFHLRQKLNGNEREFRVRKINTDVLQLGARLIQFSLDGKWLALVTQTNDVKLARLVHEFNPKSPIRVLPKLISLEQLRMPSSKTRKAALGVYPNTINRLQFSPDSRVLAVSDLSGRIKNWILSGQEDAATKEIDVPESENSSSSSDSESESEESPDQKNVKAVKIFGQHWAPNHARMPCLDSAPLILTFRPLQLVKLARGNRKTRRKEKIRKILTEATTNEPEMELDENQHVPRSTMRAQYELIVLTAQHHLYEFDILSGQLTSWSKRNPSSRLPERFRATRDRAMGALWHGRNFLWLYGNAWVFRFDVSQDFPLPPLSSESGILEMAGRKRKRESGAGDEKGIVREGLGDVKTYETVMGKGGRVVRQEVQRLDGIDEDEETGELGDDDKVDLDLDITEERGEVNGNKRKKKDEPWWCTFRFRPILGIVSLHNDGQTCEIEEEKKDKAMEVVIVERPLWDLDLPPRFVSSYER